MASRKQIKARINFLKMIMTKSKNKESKERLKKKIELLQSEMEKATE